MKGKLCNENDCPHWINKINKLEKTSDDLHIAINNAVCLLNQAPIVNPKISEAYDILRVALINYADR